MESPLQNKYLIIDIKSRGQAIFPTLQSALAISKAANCRLSLSFPKGYYVDIYPESTITDLQRIEELTSRNHCLIQELDELKQNQTSAD